MPQEHTLYLDIETLPGPADCLDWKEFEARGNLKDPEKIAADIAEKKATALTKTSFDGGWGSVCVIGFAINDGPVGSFMSAKDDGSDDGDMLPQFFMELSYSINSFSRVTICGHHVPFDIGFITKRCIVHGIKLPGWWPTDVKPWDNKIRDTMFLWAGAKDTISLDELCRILGVKGKDGFDGSMVAEAWANGEHDKVAEYCGDDVERVRQINNRFLEVGL